MAAPNAWTRERTELNAHHLKKAAKLVASGAFEGRGHEWADTEERGLVLRVGRQGAAWYLKTEARTVRLGGTDLPVKAARVAARRCREDLRAGRTPSKVNLQIFEEAHRRGFTPANARDAAFATPLAVPTTEERRRDGPWEWQDLVDLFLAKKLPTLRPKWAVQFERHLRRSAEGAMVRKLVGAVTQDDLLKVRNRVAKARTMSATADTVEAIKAAMDWGKREEPILSGLGATPYPWWREGVHVDYASEAREHTPTLEELARTLLLAERHRALGGTAKQTDNATLAALWSIVLTGQRVTALCGTKRSTTRDWPERPGWKVWTWTAAEMKGPGGGGRTRKKPKAKPHGLPIPPAALAVLERFPVDRTSRFLFPTRGDPTKALTSSAMTGLMDRLKGKSKGARGGGRTVRPEGDLLAQHDIRHWTLHDVRRTLPTFLDLERLGGAGSAILAHTRRKAAGDADEERELAQAITLRHYIHSQRMELKAEGMELWVAAVLAAYEAERAGL